MTRNVEFLSSGEGSQSLLTSFMTHDTEYINTSDSGMRVSSGFMGETPVKIDYRGGMKCYTTQYNTAKLNPP